MAATIALLPTLGKRRCVYLMTNDHDHEALEERKRDRRAAAATDRLHEMLHVGSHQAVLQFLRMHEAVRLLATCRQFRSDRLLKLSVLLVATHGQHFLHGCQEDWFLTSPYQQDHWLQHCTRVPNSCTSLWQCVGPLVPGGTSVALVSLAAFVRQRILRWCFVYESRVTEGQDDVLCEVRPVLLPLGRRSNDQQRRAWTHQDVQLALNAVQDGAGDAFVSNASTTTEIVPSPSRFAAHWDHIQVDAKTGMASCVLCYKARNEILTFCHYAAAHQQRYADALAAKRLVWQTEGHTDEELAQLVADFQQSFFPENALYPHGSANWANDRIVAHLVAHNQFGVATSAYLPTNDDVVAAFSHKYQHQCRSFYRPLKKLLLKQFAITGRVSWSQQQRASTEIMATELVGGVSELTGVLCGVYVTFRLRPVAE